MTASGNSYRTQLPQPDWHKIAEKASEENDPKKLAQLIGSFKPSATGSKNCSAAEAGLLARAVGLPKPSHPERGLQSKDPYSLTATRDLKFSQLHFLWLTADIETKGTSARTVNK